MLPRVMSTAKNVIHAISRCQDCGEEWQDYLTAQRRASQHARKERHVVSGELGVSVIYAGRKGARAKAQEREG